MLLSLRYLHQKALSIEPDATIADEHVAPLKVQWLGVASTRFASHGGFLYFVTDEHEVPSPPLDPASMFGCVVAESLSDQCKGIPRIVVSDECDLDRLFDYLVKEVDRYRNWHDMISDLLLADASYQELVDATAKFVPRPLYIADACWRMIARVDFEMPEISATWHYQTLHNGLYPLNIVETLNRTGEYHRISNLPRAELVSESPAFVLPIIAKPIRHHGRLVGYFFFIDTWGDMGPCEVEIAQEFGKMIAPLLAARGAQEGSISGFQDNFITHVLDGMLTSKRDIAHELKAETRWDLESDFRMATVRFAPGEFDNHLLHMRTMGLLGGDYDCHSYFYKDTAITIFRCADDSTTDFMQHLNRSCAALKRDIVVSERFKDFSQLPRHYDRNMRELERIEHSSSSPCVVACDSSFPEILANLCENALPYCYEVDMLHDYDKAHNTSYCNTLLEFLKNERNAVATAEALFVHRNTLRNHLSKITEIIDIDLSNPETRFRIIVSLNTLLRASKPDSDAA